MRVVPYVEGQSGLVSSQQNRSMSQAVDNNIEVSYPQHVDANNWADIFAPGNIKGVILRVAALGGTSPSGYSWTASNTKIGHNLGYLPTGWIIVYKDKNCDIKAGTTKPDTQFLYLTISDDTANTTLWVF
jgi:hypothetical protein